ncbi:MAG: hypothetical protein Q9209_004845 [Squamulea sp. 1 TL-2023]
MSWTRKDVVKELKDLTNLSEKDARILVASAAQDDWSHDDLEWLVDDAENERKIAPEVAAVAKMAIMTPLTLHRCRTLIDETRDQATGKFDLYRAITRAEMLGDIAPKIGKPARLVALMKVDLSTAKQFLAETKDKVVQRAIPYIRDGVPCEAAVADAALFRHLTNFSESQTARYLARAGKGGVQQAIRLAGDDEMFKNRHAFITALLRARFDLGELEAAEYASRSNSQGNYDYTTAMRAVLTDRFMKETMLDRQDAQALLQKANGDLQAARQMFIQERSKEPLVKAENGDTRHPPDVKGDTHIIAVCGVPDDEASSASPGKDGWMISDFYLWKHVLEGMGKSQQWLTCEDPRYLVHKYGSANQYDITTLPGGMTSKTQISWADGYLHGDPFEERRVVLDRNTLQFALQQLIITPRGVALRNEFTSRLESICRRASQANEHVLILVFSHGEGPNVKGIDLGGLALGFTPSLNASAVEFLTPSMFQASLLKTPDVKLSLFTTSCFSGHWVITPRFSLIKPNAVMAGARPYEESHAWVESASQRHVGGVYSSSFLAELLKEPPESVEDLEKAGEPNEVRLYQQFRMDILGEANRLCIGSKIGMELGSLPMFTTEGDQDPAFRRTGFALHRYKDNFDKLRRVPASDTNPYRDLKQDVQPNDPRVIDWEKRHPEGDTDYSDRTGGYGQTSRGIRSSVRYMIQIYCNSHPGPKTLPSNTSLHSTISHFLSGGLDGAENLRQVLWLRSQLLYRLWAMQEANQLTRWLNLNKVPRIQDFDFKKINLDLVDLQTKIFEAIIPFGLFFPPDVSDSWGMTFRKPARYLAYAFAASGYGPRDVEEMIPKVLEKTIKAVAKRKASSFQEDGGDRRQASIGTMMKLMSSPRKKQRRSLLSAGWMQKP